MTTSMFQEEDLREPEADWTGLPGAQVLHMEAHSREKQDFYPATVGFDFLSFIYVAIFFRYVIPTDADFANTGEWLGEAIDGLFDILSY